jgi:hypothetical protein
MKVHAPTQHPLFVLRKRLALLDKFQLQKLVRDAFWLLGRGELTPKAFASFEAESPIYAMVCSLEQAF